jgi:hypothetical protein
VTPTFETGSSFDRDLKGLTPENRQRFMAAVAQLVEDLRDRRLPRPGLRVKRVQGTNGVWELTWAPDGRATFTYGPEVVPGEPHVQWRRIGTHDIFNRP